MKILCHCSWLSIITMVTGLGRVVYSRKRSTGLTFMGWVSSSVYHTLVLMPHPHKVLRQSSVNNTKWTSVLQARLSNVIVPLQVSRILENQWTGQILAEIILYSPKFTLSLWYSLCGCSPMVNVFISHALLNYRWCEPCMDRPVGYSTKPCMDFVLYVVLPFWDHSHNITFHQVPIGDS
jgi:hypothetical protein